jgi:predicted nucleic acid-binding protein
LGLFRESVIFIEPTTPVTECRDPKDDQFLTLAISAKAKVLISSDVHLLEMHPFRGIEILQLVDFKKQFLGEPTQQNPTK